MKTTLSAAAVLLICLLCACSTVDTTWKQTKEVAGKAKEFVNPAPEIDYDSYKFENPNQEKLALLFTPVDGPLSSLINYIEDQDVYPPKEWVNLLFARFPWAHSLIVADAEGKMLERVPPLPLKRFTQPLKFEAVWRETFLKTVVDYPDLGPELYIGTPFFKDVEFMGLIVVSFDPRDLMSMCPKPEELIIVHPGGGVWSLGAEVNREGLLAVDWPELLKDNVQGQVQVGEEYYTWLVRYIGRDYFIYATRSVDPKHSESSWFF
ncbi:MAG: hypothetical protein PHV85_02590 [Desulfovibrionaceae bacterium]|nr:hypothetical protein [Desulfovibrionaceae bacterium]